MALPQAALERDAHAQSASKKKVAVGGFEGNKSADARKAFLASLKEDGSYEVTDAEDVKASAKAPAIAEAAKNLGVAVVITGKVGRTGVKLKVLNGADGTVVEEVEVKGAGGKLKGNLTKEGASAVASAVSAVQVEEEEEEPPVEEQSTEAETEGEGEAEADADSAAPSGEGISPFDITAGLRPMHRTFKFHSTVADARPSEFYQMLSHELPLGPALYVDLNWYPGSHFTTGPAEWVGLTAGYEKGVAIKTVYREERTLKTDEQQWYAGLRLRLPLGAHRLGAIATYGQHSFFLDGDSDRALIPDVKYTNVRVGIDGELRFGESLVAARIGKRFVTSTGALETVWFPNVKTSSLEAGVTLGYRLASVVDLLAGVDWLRYAFDFNPVAPRPANQSLESLVAGGAVDEYIVGHVGLRFRLPGASE